MAPSEQTAIGRHEKLSSKEAGKITRFMTDVRDPPLVLLRPLLHPLRASRERTSSIRFVWGMLALSSAPESFVLRCFAYCCLELPFLFTQLLDVV